MSGDIIQLNPEAFLTELKSLVKNGILPTWSPAIPRSGCDFRHYESVPDHNDPEHFFTPCFLFGITSRPVKNRRMHGSGTLKIKGFERTAHLHPEMESSTGLPVFFLTEACRKDHYTDNKPDDRSSASLMISHSFLQPSKLCSGSANKIIYSATFQ